MNKFVLLETQRKCKIVLVIVFSAARRNVTKLTIADMRYLFELSDKNPGATAPAPVPGSRMHIGGAAAGGAGAAGGGAPATGAAGTSNGQNQTARRIVPPLRAPTTWGQTGQGMPLQQQQSAYGQVHTIDIHYVAFSILVAYTAVMSVVTSFLPIAATNKVYEVCRRL